MQGILQGFRVVGSGSKLGREYLAFILLLAQGCQEDYEMIDPPMMTDYDDDLDEEVIMQLSLIHI